MRLLEILQNLCPIPAPPGQEADLRETIRVALAAHAQFMEQDRAGNLQAWINVGRKPCLMLDAHMDEVGVMIQSVEDNGCLRMVPMGGLEAKLLPGSKILLQSRQGQGITGLVGLAPPHVAKNQEQVTSWEDTWLDIGASSREEASATGVETGTCGVLDAGQGMLGHDGFYARNLDNRVGCALLIWLMEQMADQEINYSICFNFSVAEEVGLRGATSAAFHIAPDMALVVEATVGDTPGLAAGRNPSYMGKGSAITVMDGRQIVPWEMVKSLEAAATAAQVNSQRKRPPSGGTDGGAIAISREGVPTAVLSVPVRYIHSPVSWLKISDLDATAQLLKRWVLNFCPLL